MFQGMNEDTYRFFWEIAFHNEKSFFEENRARYRKSVYEPMRELTEALTGTVLGIDDRLNVRPASCISRIRRDTRYTKDKSLYRDHAWIGFRMPGTYISESFVLYVGLNRDSYEYGMGMYAPNSEMMGAFRGRILAKPHAFLALVEEPHFQERFTLEGETYKRIRFPDADQALQPYVNRKNLSFCYSSPQLSRTMEPGFAQEITEAFLQLKPVYRFLMGLN